MTKPQATYGDRIVWIDVETTALQWDNPRTLVLEVGMYITDLSMTHVASEAAVISRSRERLNNWAHWNDVARTMHTENGLIKECASRHAVTLDAAQERFLLFLSRYTSVDLTKAPDSEGAGSGDPEAPLWGGCSATIDRMMIKRDMPRVYERIHYRTLDASCLRECMRMWVDQQPRRAKEPHRALEDARSASRLANKFRRLMIQMKRVAVP